MKRWVDLAASFAILAFLVLHKNSELDGLAVPLTMCALWLVVSSCGAVRRDHV